MPCSLIFLSQSDLRYWWGEYTRHETIRPTDQRRYNKSITLKWPISSFCHTYDSISFSPSPKRLWEGDGKEKRVLPQKSPARTDRQSRIERLMIKQVKYSWHLSWTWLERTPTIFIGGDSIPHVGTWVGLVCSVLPSEWGRDHLNGNNNVPFSPQQLITGHDDTLSCEGWLRYSDTSPTKQDVVNRKYCFFLRLLLRDLFGGLMVEFIANFDWLSWGRRRYFWWIRWLLLGIKCQFKLNISSGAWFLIQIDFFNHIHFIFSLWRFSSTKPTTACNTYLYDNG